MKITQPLIEIYTDGGSRNHGNVRGGHVKTTDPAAWAVHLALIDRATDKRLYEKELTGGQVGATNSRMELEAVIQGLSALKRNDWPIVVCLDSKYVSNPITKGWLAKWAANDFQKRNGLANADQWRQLDALLKRFDYLTFRHVAGHAGVTLNERVDQLVNQTMDAQVAKMKAGD